MLTLSTGTIEPSELIQQLRRLMDQLRPVSAARQASPTTFLHKDLTDSTHVFLRQDALRRALEPQYSGPYKAYMMDEAEHEPRTASPLP